MRNIILFAMALILSMATCSQTAGRRTTAPRGGGQDVLIRGSILFEDGSLDEFTEFSWDAGLTRVEFESRFPASGGYTSDRGERLGFIEQIEFTFNPRGDIVNRNIRNTENQQTGRVTYQYNPLHFLQRETVNEITRGRSGPQFRDVAINVFSWDEKGNMTRRQIVDRNNNVLAETVFAYDAQDRLIRSESTSIAGGVIGSTVFAYDASGNLIREEARDGAGNVTVTTRTWQGGFPPAGDNNITYRETRVETVDARGTALRRVTNTYLENGDPDRRVIENIQGGSTQIIQFEYGRPAARR